MDYLLVKPDKNRHRYVVGIDFGHGETSAAWYELEWDKSAGKRESIPHDVELIGNLKVIPSAINITPDGRCYIGKDAFYECDSLTQITIPHGIKTSTLGINSRAKIINK